MGGDPSAEFAVVTIDYRAKVRKMPKVLNPHPAPTRRHFAVLGQHHGATVAACIAAFERLGAHYDPRRHPELALIVDADRLAEVAV